MNNDTRAVGRVMIVAAAVFGAFAQEQPARSQVRGAMTRSSMYLRLFREIADFEARADAEEAKGVTPSKLRNYHQWRMGLSPVRGAQLRDAALECLKGLNSEGLVDERGGSPGGARVPGSTERIMERVGAAVDSLAAAMGPAEFAYLDSLVRRYMATPTLGSKHRGPSAGPGGALETVSPLPMAKLTASCSSAPHSCDYPTGEDSTGTPPGQVPQQAYQWSQTEPYGMPVAVAFYPYVTPNGSDFAYRNVYEELSADDDSSCRSIDGNGPPLIPGNPSNWQLLAQGQYDSSDGFLENAAWIRYYLLKLADYSLLSCGATSVQTMYMDCDFDTDNPYYPYTENAMMFGLTAEVVSATRGNATVNMQVWW